jgi:hypothetical protein
MDEELERRFDELHRQLNDGFERVHDRLTTIEATLRDLDTKHDSTQAMILALPAAVSQAIEDAP